MTNDRPIFVVGCPRSGTTMVQLMLHAHPRIAIPPETRFVLEGYWRRADFGDLHDAANRRRLARWIVDESSNFRDLGLNSAEIVEEIVAGPPTLGSAMGIVLRAYARRFGKPRWGDKRPAYLRNLDVVLRLFPDAQIINVIRDGRDCVASLKEMPWHRTGLYHGIAAWAQAVDSSRWAARRLSRDSYYELRYERLVQEPAAGLAALCEFLGEPYDEAMTEPAACAPVAVPAYKTWHARTHAPVGPDRVGTWTNRLEPGEIALCESLLGSRLRTCGYELSGAGRPTVGQLARYAPLAVRSRLGRVRRAAVSAYEWLHPPAPVAARLTPGQVPTQPRRGS